MNYHNGLIFLLWVGVATTVISLPIWGFLADSNGDTKIVKITFWTSFTLTIILGFFAVSWR